MTDNTTGEVILALDDSMLNVIRTRRWAGESLSALAAKGMVR